MNYTKQQKQAINAEGSSVIVSAAAGSGKTAVLTERIIKLISDPDSGVNADRIIVVTFTKDAAAEMKKRIDEKLRDLINSSPDKKQHLLKQQILLQNAKISTINAFCFDLLRDNITEQGITSGFEILDESAEKVIKSQAMDELLDWYSREEYEKISHLYDCFCLKNHRNLVNVITNIDKFLSSIAMVDDWFSKALAECRKDFSDSIYCTTFFENISRKANEVLNGLEKNAELLNNIFYPEGAEYADKHITQAQEDISRIQRLVYLAEHRLMPSDEDIEYITGFVKIESIPKNTIVCNKELRDVYKDRRNELKKKLIKIIERFNSVEDTFEESRRTVEILVEVLRKYHEIIWERKCEKNAISFGDGERLALQLLAETDENGNMIQSEIARSISDYYSVIMIDEYQDSNNKQDLIFKLLSKNYHLDENGTPVYGDNVFLVGDVKQSIYRFRLANPKNFIDITRNAKPYNEDGENSGISSILLNSNFRSSEETLKFINFIFTEIMSTECGDIEYNSSEMLSFGAGQYRLPHNDSRFPDIMLINTDAEPDEDDETAENPEAEVTAQKIADMIKNRAQVIEPDGTSRDCTPSDFCILMRSKFSSKAYVKALEDRNISAKGPDEKGYLKSQEIVILINLLRIIANPLKDIPMSAVMLSPMYMFTIEELSYIRSFNTEKQIYQLLIDIAGGEYPEFDDKLKVKCAEFLESIDKFRLDSVTMTIGELINSIYDTTDFISVMQIYKDGDKKRANLRMLIHYAQSYEKFSAADDRGGLSGFLRHIDRLAETADYDKGKVSLASGDYVTVQSMHGSKGLEYPFVFICETSRKFKLTEEDDDKNSFNKVSSVICSDDGRIGFIVYNKGLFRRYKTFQYTLLADEKERYTRSEEMRLLYVAMTRAKQKLFINLRCGKKETERAVKLMQACISNGSSIKTFVSEAIRFSDWLWLSLMMHSDFAQIAQCIGIDTSESGVPAYDKSEKLFEYEYFPDGAVKAEALEETTISANVDEAVVDNLRNIINSRYDRTLSETTAKLSVTQISKKFSEVEEYDFHLLRPHFISGRKKLTGAERGTAIHTFFQYCDFDNTINDIAGEVKRLTELGYLTEPEAECIDYGKVKAFFESDLYKRVKSAKKYEREKKFMAAASQLSTDNPLFEKFRDTDNMIKGIIDLMYEDEDGIVIVDYKSDRGLDEESLKDRYRKQLEIYKSAVELITGKKVKQLVLYSIELRKAVIL